MTRPPLATTISSLLVASMIITPTLAFGADVQSSAAREVDRRYQYERTGLELLDNGDRALKARDYDKAQAFYKKAVDYIPNAPQTQKSYNRALASFCNASCLLAEQRITEGRYGEAEAILRIVIDDRYNPRYKRAHTLLAQLEDPSYYNKTITPGLRANIEKVKQLMVDAQGFYDTAQYDKAFKRCEQVLNIDPYNKAARMMEEQIDRAKSDFAVVSYNETRARAIQRVDAAWANPVRRFNVNPSAVLIDSPTTSGNLSIRIQRKLERIIIPKLEFREATIREAVDYLKRKSVELDPDEPKTGVNIVLKLDGSNAGVTVPDAVAPPAVAPIPGLGDVAPPPVISPVASTASPDARITVSLSNIPLGEALKYVTNLANLKYKVEPYAVYVVPASTNTDILVTKEWKIRPDLIPRTAGPGGATGLAAPPAFGAPSGGTGDASKGGSGIADRESAKNWLISNGVQFNGQASAIYIVSSSRLIVRNTQEQLDLIDTIIQSSSPQGPTQVEIEAKFVEISQNNFKELSFDWLLGQANFPANKNVFFGGGTPGTSAGVNPLDYPFVAPGNQVVGQYPLTSGNRSGTTAIRANAVDALLFGNANPTTLLSPAIGAVSGVFTDPQFQVVIRALNQRKGVDLLSSPRVTTKSGQRAVIEIIREFRYPTEFDPPQIPQQVGGNIGGGGIIGPGGGIIGGGNNNNNFPVTPTTPTNFEVRNTGVTLEVEPVVGPDGYTIDLNLVPQVVEFEGFINYGSPIQTTNTDLLGRPVVSVITPNVINQPIFSTRKVTTSVSVFDGNTVVIGGLMREDVQKVEDKVPLLGDIPILGRLFRSSVDQHLKRNLVIFVSARLMNPAGEPVRQDEEKEEVVEVLPTTDLGPIDLPLFSK